MTGRRHVLSQGAELREGGGVRFRIWAPGCESMRVAIVGGETIAMTRGEHGWHEAEIGSAGPGTRYRFVLPDGMAVPDPASRYQPEDVHGPSEVIDPAAYRWEHDFDGRPWSEAVVYELHVGTFTPAGTFLGAIEKLDHLAALGITAIEIMPVADFPGRRNWGYDGVLLYAPDSQYGRPEDLKALVDAAHARGIMVILDCVYNHFGPDGNFLPVYAPDFFTERHKTPWGAGINYDGRDGRPVRDFAIHNALYWLEEYDLDGLRLDAVHAIMDDSATHLLDELAHAVHRLRGSRPTHLILENESNQASRLEREADGRPRTYTAQWNDDVHHVLHVAATGETAGYYKEYAERTDLLARALAEGFAFQGETMEYSEEERGEPSGHLPPVAFVAFAQNHDQIGNRAFGDRLSATVSADKLRAIAAIVLLGPQTPMLFMGEEWGARSPFAFFCDFEGELAEAVRKGRRDEFKRFPEFEDPEKRDRIPDPLADTTFENSKLDWGAIDEERLAHTAGLLRRRRELLPVIASVVRGGNGRVIADGVVEIVWHVPDRDNLVLFANLSDDAVERGDMGTVLHQEGEPGGPWSVTWSRRAP